MTTAPLEAVILAGGKGTRLQSLVGDRPKPLAVVAGRPFIEWLLLALRAQGVRRVILSTGYKGEMIAAHFAEHPFAGLELVYSPEASPLGTAGALRQALTLVRAQRCLALNGDSYCPINLEQLLAFHQARAAAATLWLVPVEDGGRYGSVEVAGDGAVLSFREKQAERRPGLINAGVYLLERAALETIPLGRAVSMETEFMPGLIGRGLYATHGAGPFVDIGLPDSYQAAGQILHSELRRLEGLRP